MLGMNYVSLVVQEKIKNFVGRGGASPPILRDYDQSLFDEHHTATKMSYLLEQNELSLKKNELYFGTK